MPRKTPIYGFNLFYHDESVISAEDVRPGSAYTGTLQPDPTNTLNYNFKLMEDLVQSILNGRLAFTSISTVQDVIAGRDVVVGRQLILNPEYGLILNADHRPSPHILLDFADALAYAGDADNTTLTVTAAGNSITNGTQKNPFKPDNSTLTLSGNSVYPVVFTVSSSGTLIDASLSAKVRLYLSFNTVPQGLSGVRLESSQDGSTFTTIGYYTQNLGNKYLLLGPATLTGNTKAVRITLEGTNSTSTNFKVRRVALLHEGTPALEGFYLPRAGGSVYGNVTVKGNITATGTLQATTIQGSNSGILLINARNYGLELRIDEDANGTDTFRITRGSSGSTTLMVVQSGGNVGIGTSSPAQKLDVAGNISGTQFISTASTGTAPFQVSSTTKVTNLNADLLDGYDSADFPRKAENATISGTWTFSGAPTFSTTPTFSAGLRITGGASTWTTSGWAKALDLNKGQALVWRTGGGLAIGLGVAGSTNTVYFSSSTADDNSATVSYPIVFDIANGRIGVGTTSPSEKIDVSGGNIRAVQLKSTATTGTAPFVVSSTTTVTNLSADMVDGLHASQFLRSDADTTYNGTTLTVNGNIVMAAGKTVDGVDISVFKSAYDVHEHNGTDAPKVKAENVLAQPYNGTSYSTTVKAYLDSLQTQINNLIQGTTTADTLLVNQLTVNNTISAGTATATISTLTVNNNATVKGDLTVEGGANAIAIKESSFDSTPGYLEKVGGGLRLTHVSTTPIAIYRGTTAGQADLEILKDAGSGDLPIYLRFHQGSRYWISLKATRGLLSVVTGDDTGYVDFQAKRVTATQDLVVGSNTIANSSGIPYAPLPALGNRDRDILVDRVAVWGDGMYPFALDLFKSDGWFTIPRTVYYYNGRYVTGSTAARSGTTRVLRMYIVGVDNARSIYDPTNQYWNNGRTTGIPWIRLIKGSNTWESALSQTWGGSPNVRVYVIELPTSFLNDYFQVALGIWWNSTSPSWPSANISGDTVPNNYQNYGADIQWTIYQVWFEIYDRY
jgi:hypothetical protein